MRTDTLIQNKDGSEVKIVCQLITNICQKFSIDSFVLVRDSSNDPWRVCRTDDAKTVKECGSVENYTKFGRSELWTRIRPHQLLKATQEFREEVVSKFGVMAQFM